MSLNDFRDKLKNIKVALFDLDGTLYLENEPISGAVDAVEKFREKGIKVVYLTNNSSKTPSEYQKKLQKLGFFKQGDVIYSSLTATVQYLKEYHSNQKIYLFGTAAAKKYFCDNEIELCDRADIAVLSYNTEMTYSDICLMNENLNFCKHYIATHLDVLCPSKGVFLPDNGAVAELFKKSANKYPEVVIGKPNTLMGDMIKKSFNVDSSNVLMVGDRLYTDIQFGMSCGFLTALVLSGETSKEQCGGVKCSIFDSVCNVSGLL